MKSSGLLLIIENKHWSSLCARLFEELTSEERERVFQLVEDQNIEQLLEEEYRRKHERKD